MCLCAYVKKTYVPMSKKLMCLYLKNFVLMSEKPYVLMSEGYFALSA